MQAATQPAEGVQRYLARQPIFDRYKHVIGYELLFRSGAHNYFDCPDADSAARRLLDSSLLYGLEPLLAGKKAFINFTEETLLHDYPALLPKDAIIVELLETIRATEPVMDACRKLKERGYTIALDDFRPMGPAAPLVQFADILKVDWLASPRLEREALARHFVPQGMKLLAEKVETHTDFHCAQELGYALFQGYFFCKPQMLRARDIPGFKLNYLRILKEVSRPEIDLAALEDIFRQEPSLLFKLLRYLNSPIFGLRRAISSVRHAIAMLGSANLRKWVSVVAVGAMAGDKPAELVVASLVRARFCELLAANCGMEKDAADLFLLGLMSLMNAILDRPMSDILRDIPVREEIKQALGEEQGPFERILAMVVSFERGYWTHLSELATENSVSEANFPEHYRNAVALAQAIFAA